MFILLLRPDLGGGSREILGKGSLFCAHPSWVSMGTGVGVSFDQTMACYKLISEEVSGDYYEDSMELELHWVQILTPLLTSCEAWGKMLNVSEL